jgi:protein involved in polysaccharide export with SLBB domain
LRTWLGEWFLDTSLGVPYIQNILTKGATVEQIKTFIKAAATSTAGVESVDELEVTLTAARTCTVTLKATSNQGVPFSITVTP